MIAYRHFRELTVPLVGRDQKRAERLAEPAGPGGQLDAEYGGASGDAVMLADVRAAVRRLPRWCREVVVLRYVEGFTVAETAEILDGSEGAIKSYAAEGRTRLADLLKTYDPGEGDR